MTVSTGDGVESPIIAPAPAYTAVQRRTGIRRALGFRDRLVKLWDVVAVGAAYGAASLLIFHNVWVHPSRRAFAHNPGDQAFQEWMLAHAATVFTNPDNPFLTTQLNYPDGVNIMGNTSVLLPGILLTPVTLSVGPAVALIALLMFNLAATGLAWYYVLSRRLNLPRPAALVGATFCAFAPAMVSHSSGHANLTAGFLLPFVLDRVLRLGRPGRAVRNGVVLGLLVAAQLFVGMELLFVTAVACGLFVLGYALMSPAHARQHARTYLGSVAVTAGVAGALLAYPIWFLFAGPQSYLGSPWRGESFSADLASYLVFPPDSIAGGLSDTRSLGPSFGAPSEENTFFGLPLLVTLLVLFAILWRHRGGRAGSCTAIIMILLSLGPTVIWYGRSTGVPGPWRLVGHLPVFGSALPSRIGLVIVPIVGVLIAYGWSVARSFSGPRWARAVRIGIPVLVVASLVPLAPTMVPASYRYPVPRFVTEGGWRDHVRPGHTMVVVPGGSYRSPDAMRWNAAVGLEFAIPEGIFIGPKGPNREAGIGPSPRPTAQLLDRVVHLGGWVKVTEEDRQRAREDLAYWKADCVVLGSQPLHDSLLVTVTDLLGPPTRVVDVWLWRV